jgi:intracellular sulfur oxidation DsrE/DsrF family protein
MKTVFVINNDQMGHGDIELGSKILATCLRKLLKFPDLEAVVLYNAGVKLATRDSPVASELHQLHEAGVDILPCGTCIEHYGLYDRMILDRVSDMDEILATLRDADKVITL